MKLRVFASLRLLLVLALMAPGQLIPPQRSSEVPAWPSAAPQAPGSRTGWLTITWGDGPRGLPLQLEPIYTFTDEAGQATRLRINERIRRAVGDILALNGQRVTVWGEWQASAVTAPAVLEVEALRSAAEVAPAAVIGPQPWASILCKFSDVSAEPKPLTYFQQMYGSTYPGLDHYWREQSYDLINVLNSQAYGWFTLPHPRAYYIAASANLSLLAADCTAAAEPVVDFTDFVGFNLMFNDNLDCCAWGGAWFGTLDGVSQSWRTTWLPTWGFEDLTVVSHEMGHGFGLPHSGGTGLEYNDSWDVMGDIWGFCSLSTHPTYGCLAPHTIGYHKDIRLGWIPPSQKFLADWNTTTTITLEQSALPQTGHSKVAQILTCNSWQYYTVEVRRQAGYDVKVPGNAVILHEVLTFRGFPAEVVDADGNGNTGDAGAMWTVGETFTDPEAGITLTVNAATASGFVVSLANVPPVPCQPDAPYMMYPSFGSSQSSRTINFVWEPTYSLHPDRYDFRLSTTDDPETPPWLVDTSFSPTSTGYTYTVPADGAYYWYMRTWNTFNQASPWSAGLFNVDTLSPTVSFVSPLEHGFLKGDEAEIEVSAADAGTGVVFVQISIGFNDGSGWGWHESFEDDWPDDGWAVTWDTSTVPDQAGIALEALALDQAGNLARADLGDITLDRVRPASAVAALPAQSSSPLFVTWSGSDATSGILSYTVQYRDGNPGTWLDWQVGVTTTSALFTGLVGHTYYFRSRASDRAGHLELWPAVADASTTINGLSTETPTPTATPTSTPTATPTATSTPTSTPTATSTPPNEPHQLYLPIVRR